MNLRLPFFALFLALLVSITGCELLKPVPEKKGKGPRPLKAPQTGSNIRKMEKAPSRTGPAAKRSATKKKPPKPEAKEEKKRASGVVDENYVPRGGFR